MFPNSGQSARIILEENLEKFWKTVPLKLMKLQFCLESLLLYIIPILGIAVLWIRRCLLWRTKLLKPQRQLQLNNMNVTGLIAIWFDYLFRKWKGTYETIKFLCRICSNYSYNICYILIHFSIFNQSRIEWMTEIYHLDELCISKAPSENYVCILIKRVLTRLLVIAAPFWKSGKKFPWSPCLLLPKVLWGRSPWCRVGSFYLEFHHSLGPG